MSIFEKSVSRLQFVSGLDRGFNAIKPRKCGATTWILNAIISRAGYSPGNTCVYVAHCHKALDFAKGYISKRLGGIPDNIVLFNGSGNVFSVAQYCCSPAYFDETAFMTDEWQHLSLGYFSETISVSTPRPKSVFISSVLECHSRPLVFVKWYKDALLSEMVDDPVGIRTTMLKTPSLFRAYVSGDIEMAQAQWYSRKFREYGESVRYEYPTDLSDLQ